MRKVALITLYDSNIGNRLQNYAVQQILQRHGFQSCTYWYTLKLTAAKKIKSAVKIILGCFISRYRTCFVQWKRKKRFEKFTEKYIKKGKKINVYKKIRFEDKFAYYVTGSDQVWHNWHNFEQELEYFYLQFVPREKRISFAPSIGLNKFPDEDTEIHRRGLNGMKALSCREKAGCELIQELTGREAELLSDPTMLLDKSEWIKIEKKPEYEVSDKYILLYFLGRTESYVNHTINEYAEEHNCKIINIFDRNLKKQYLTAPDEFIYLIHHAAYIFTDSFHACAFSIIFEKDFLVCSREEAAHEKMGTRIDNLFEKFQMESRWYVPNRQIDCCNYKKRTIILEEEKKKADEFIDRYMK